MSHPLEVPGCRGGGGSGPSSRRFFGAEESLKVSLKAVRHPRTLLRWGFKLRQEEGFLL